MGMKLWFGIKGWHPYRTQTHISLQQWRTRQLIYQLGANDPEKVDVVMAELESNIARSKKIYNVYLNEQKALLLFEQVRILKGKISCRMSGNKPKNSSGLSTVNGRGFRMEHIRGAYKQN